MATTSDEFGRKPRSICSYVGMLAPSGAARTANDGFQYAAASIAGHRARLLAVRSVAERQLARLRFIRCVGRHAPRIGGSPAYCGGARARRCRCPALRLHRPGVERGRLASTNFSSNVADVLQPLTISQSLPGTVLQRPSTRNCGPSCGKGCSRGACRRHYRRAADATDVSEEFSNEPQGIEELRWKADDHLAAPGSCQKTVHR